MTAPIGPGDFCECIQNRTPQTMPPVGLVVGAVYLVEAVGRTDSDDEHPSHPWVRLAGVRLRPGKQGFRLEWFKPVYPGGELKRLLLEKPVESKPRQKVTA